MFCLKCGIEIEKWQMLCEDCQMIEDEPEKTSERQYEGFIEDDYY